MLLQSWFLLLLDNETTTDHPMSMGSSTLQHRF
jgi:hypothetical protein